MDGSFCLQASESGLGSFSPDDIKDFSPPQVVEFLAQLVDKVELHWSLAHTTETIKLRNGF